LEIKYFLECILKNHRPRVSIGDGLKALRMAQDISKLVNEKNHRFIQQPQIMIKEADLFHGYSHTSNR
jgi:hypothetical protein